MVSAPFVWPDMSFVGWAAFVPLLFAIEGQGASRATAWGFLAGLVTHMAGLYWIPGLLVRFAHMPLALALLIWLLLGSWGGVMYALVGLSCALVGRRRTGLPPLVVLPVAYVAVEFAFPQVFPWTLAGGQYRFLPFIQASELMGTLGLSGLLVLASAAVYELVSPRARTVPAAEIKPWWALLALGLILAVVFCGDMRLRAIQRIRQSAPILRVGIVQPSVGIREKGEAGLSARHLDNLKQMSAGAIDRGAGLVVWPESAYPYRIHRGAQRAPLGRKAIVEGKVPVLFGAVSFDATGMYNSAFVASPGGGISPPADKSRLVPFSERIPAKGIIPTWLKRKYRFLDGGFEPGKSPAIIEHGGLRLGVLNCFEDTIPAKGREVVKAGATLLVNVTNDAWFGDTAEPHQHLALSVFRAVENRRDLVRSVNTGVSAVIQATGEVQASTATFERAILVEDVRLLEVQAAYTMLGDIVGWGSLLGLVLMGLWASIRSRRGRGAQEGMVSPGSGRSMAVEVGHET